MVPAFAQQLSAPTGAPARAGGVEERYRRAAPLEGRPLRHPGARRRARRLRRTRHEFAGDRAGAAGRAAACGRAQGHLVPDRARRWTARLDPLCAGHRAGEYLGQCGARASCARSPAPRPSKRPPRRRRPAEPKPAEALPDDRIVQLRPMGRPLEPVIPEIDPAQVPPPAPLLPRETVPVPDRWRLADALGVVHQRWFDPYNQNVLKGDRPVCGDDWFFNLSARSPTRCSKPRRFPTRSARSRRSDPGSSTTVRPRQAVARSSQTLIAELALIKGDTTFKPPDYEFRFVPVINFNRTEVDEVRRAATSIRATGTTRNDSHVGLQEAFVDYHLRNVSDRYDFDSIRVGIQPFISDFRGFLFHDEPARRAPLRQPRQQPLAVQPRLVPAPGEGHQQRPQRRRPAAARRRRLRRQPLPPGLPGPGLHLAGHGRSTTATARASAVYYDDNGFLDAPGAARRRARRTTTTSSISATTATATSAA